MTSSILRTAGLIRGRHRAASLGRLATSHTIRRVTLNADDESALHDVLGRSPTAAEAAAFGDAFGIAVDAYADGREEIESVDPE